MIKFEWDKQKAKSNLKKHGVSFEAARSVFYDDNAMQFFDSDNSESEDRFLMLGLSHNFEILLVCYCVREEGEIIRIISARKATAKERNFYPVYDKTRPSGLG